MSNTIDRREFLRGMGLFLGGGLVESDRVISALAASQEASAQILLPTHEQLNNGEANFTLQPDGGPFVDAIKQLMDTINQDPNHQVDFFAARNILQAVADKEAQSNPNAHGLALEYTTSEYLALTRVSDQWEIPAEVARQLVQQISNLPIDTTAGKVNIQNLSDKGFKLTGSDTVCRFITQITFYAVNGKVSLNNGTVSLKTRITCQEMSPDGTTYGNTYGMTTIQESKSEGHPTSNIFFVLNGEATELAGNFTNLDQHFPNEDVIFLPVTDSNEAGSSVSNVVVEAMFQKVLDKEVLDDERHKLIIVPSDQSLLSKK